MMRFMATAQPQLSAWSSLSPQSPEISGSTARYPSTPVMTQMDSTESRAPRVSARCQLKFMVLVAGREDIQKEKRLMSMLAKPVSSWAA